MRLKAEDTQVVIEGVSNEQISRKCELGFKAKLDLPTSIQVYGSTTKRTTRPDAWDPISDAAVSDMQVALAQGP